MPKRGMKSVPGLEMERLVALLARKEGEERLLGTGCRVNDDLVLTAAHVIETKNRSNPMGTRFRIRSAGGKWLWVGQVVWSSPSRALDAALIRLEQTLSRPGPQESPPSLKPVKWGRFLRDRDGEAVSAGYPALARTGSEQVGELVDAAGSLRALGGVEQGLYEIRPDLHPNEAKAWKGLSGAPVFCSGRLTALVRTGPKGGGGRVLWAMPVERLIKEKGRFWEARFREKIGEDLYELDDFRRQAERGVGAITLRGGAGGRTEAEALLADVGGMEKGMARLFRRYLRDLQMRKGEGVAALAPDLLGEALVGRVLRKAGRDWTDFLDKALRGAGEDSLRQAFTVLGGLDAAGASEGRTWLRHVLGRDVEGRALPAFEAALGLGRRSAVHGLGKVLAEAMEAEGTLAQARAMEARLSKKSVPLLHLAVWATERVLSCGGGESGGKSKIVEQPGSRFERIGL